MPIDNWSVEEEITAGLELDIRAVYIRLLQQVIDAIKEQYVPEKQSDLPATSFQEVVDEIKSGPIFVLPTVIFAYLSEEEGKALAQLICYRDRREFLKDLIHYGDEEYIKEFGLSGFLAESMPEHTA